MELRYALNNLPETIIKVLQAFVSLRRMEHYLQGTEITPSDGSPTSVAFRSATVSWPQDANTRSQASSAASTPRRRFMLTDLSVEFPKGDLSLVCGKLGSGKVSGRWLSLRGIELNDPDSRFYCSRSWGRQMC